MNIRSADRTHFNPGQDRAGRPAEFRECHRLTIERGCGSVNRRNGGATVKPSPRPLVYAEAADNEETHGCLANCNCDLGRNPHLESRLRCYVVDDSRGIYRLDFPVAPGPIAFGRRTAV